MTVSVLRLVLAGDVMTGRGVDQILPHPSPPDLYERWVQHAEDYVTLAEHRNGAIRRPMPFDYVWGDTLAELARTSRRLKQALLRANLREYLPD